MTEADGIACMWMRGGTSKGAFFEPADLPADPAVRDALLLRIMGTPDPRQVDGIGGATLLTSKVAIVSASASPEADLDYLFLQLGVDAPTVSDAQTCGNLLAAVGPFAVERGLIPADASRTSTRIRLLNTGAIVRATFSTPGGGVSYRGDARIDGVPGTAAPIELASTDAVPFLPTGEVSETLAGHRATLVDNGMPVVLLDAAEFGVTGEESVTQLDENAELAAELARVHAEAARRFGIADAPTASVPKLLLLLPPRAGGQIGVRAFIPRRAHPAIGVLMAASLAAGVHVPGAVGHDLTAASAATLDIEHPSGIFAAHTTVVQREGVWLATATTSLRTARKLFDGHVFPAPAPTNDESDLP